MKKFLVAQSGGPTSAINATLAGVIEVASHSEKVSQVLGAKHGIEGVLNEDFIDVTTQARDSSFLDMLSRTPSSALGSCRYKLNTSSDEEFEKIIHIFCKYDIGYFVYIGGNDSMDTVYKLSAYIQRVGITDIKVIGAPKTIDNDLYGIDHCPGFGSAAKYVSTIFSELERELNVYDVNYVLIVEMMGRNAGWLTAAASLAKENSKNLPYLIYLEESEFSFDGFITDIKEALNKSKGILVAVSEGIKDKTGIYISDIGKKEIMRDAFGHSQPGGVGKILETLVKDRIGCKVRSIELSLLQRCAGHLMSKTDIEESMQLGRQATNLALQGESGKMSSLVRVSNVPYIIEYTAIDIAEVANKEKKVPKEWIVPHGVTKEMIEYLKPLVQGEITSIYKEGLPEYITLY